MKNDYTIIYLPSAQEDLQDIVRYLKRDSSDQLEPFLQNLDHSISQLKKFPNKGIIPKDLRLQRLGYRILIVEKYLIFYVICGYDIEIRRIVHGSRGYFFVT